MTSRDTFERVAGMMVALFQLDPQTVTMEARLVEDLDLDSIDAIDMAVKVQEVTGRRLEEEELRGLRTVGDVVEVVERMQQAEAAPGE